MGVYFQNSIKHLRNFIRTNAFSSPSHLSNHNPPNPFFSKLKNKIKGKIIDKNEDKVKNGSPFPPFTTVFGNEKCPFAPPFPILKLLYLSSFLYYGASSFRRNLYQFGILKQTRLPVPIISVGNLTWGGNGKTPMVEYIAKRILFLGITPLVLTRGYGGGDEARLLEKHFSGSFLAVGVGPNRAAVAKTFFEKRKISKPVSEKELMVRWERLRAVERKTAEKNTTETAEKNFAWIKIAGKNFPEKENVEKKCSRELEDEDEKKVQRRDELQIDWYRGGNERGEASSLSIGAAVLDDGMQNGSILSFSGIWR